VQANPELLHAPQMKFLKDYIESFGGKVPKPGGGGSSSSGPAPAKSATQPSVEEVDSDDDMPPLQEVSDSFHFAQ
jgi:hypothetical protein